MRNWGSMEDYTGMAYIREHIPAENDVYKKMKPVWGKLHYPNGELLYEGFMVDQMAYGAGRSYHPYGHPCHEGLFGPNGLICGREYYNNGQIRFEGTYQYNQGFGENWPIFGAYYDAEGNLKYYGAFDIIDEEGDSVRPYVMEPEDYGPVMNPLITRPCAFLCKGVRAWKYYQEESPEFREKVCKAEKENQRQIYPRERYVESLRKKLSSIYPEIRGVAEQELKRMGEWRAEDEAVLNRRKEYRPKWLKMAPEERYKRDLRLLDVPRSVHEDYMRQCSGKPVEERKRLFTRFSRLLESMYPYKWGNDPRHYKFGSPLKGRGINPENWLWHLDEMTDREISYMLEQEPGVGRLNEERLIYPCWKDRLHAEFIRDF